MNELRDEVGSEDFNEVLDLFLEEVEEVMARLSGSPDPSTYESELHFLKGSALNLGFESLAKECSDGEIVARGSNAAGIDIGSIVRTYNLSKVEFSKGSHQDHYAA